MTIADKLREWAVETAKYVLVKMITRDVAHVVGEVSFSLRHNDLPPELLAEIERDRKDAERYRYLKPLYYSIDFEYGDERKPVILFSMPMDTRWSCDIDGDLDAAIAAIDAIAGKEAGHE